MKRFYKENKTIYSSKSIGVRFFLFIQHLKKNGICVFLLLFEKLINTDKQENQSFVITIRILATSSEELNY
jgi:hypothetical protein